MSFTQIYAKLSPHFNCVVTLPEKPAVQKYHQHEYFFFILCHNSLQIAITCCTVLTLL